MFNIGGAELLVILLVALLVLGPDKLPQAARQVGHFVGEFQRVARGFRQELADALDQEKAGPSPSAPAAEHAKEDAVVIATAIRPVAEPEPGQMTLFEHLAELRNRLFKSVLAVVLGATVCWFFYDQILNFLVQPYCQATSHGCALFVTDPLEGFRTRLQIAGYGGIALAMPFLLWQVWAFITPGLHKHERRYALPFVASAVTLFAMGAALAFWTLPKALDFLINIGGTDLQEIYSPSKYLSLITYMMLAFGLGFEFPILLVFLQLAGIVTPEKLAASRRWAIVIIFVLVAVLTPSADPYSQIVLSVPMVLFYELSILIGRALRRRRAVAIEA